MKNPKVSIITVVYNGALLIERTIQSVIGQTYPNIEYIIVDGNSTDDTLSIVSHYKNQISRVISEPDNGIYDAMNKGLAASTGDWINFLNTGDTFADDHLLDKVFGEHDTAGLNLIYGDRFNLYSNRKKAKQYIKANHITRESLKRDFGVCHQSIFARRTVTPFYDLQYKLKGEYKWLIDLVYSIEPSSILQLPFPIVNYLGGGISEQRAVENLKERIRLTKEEFGLGQAVLNAPHYVRVLGRYYKNRLVLKI